MNVTQDRNHQMNVDYESKDSMDSFGSFQSGKGDPINLDAIRTRRISYDHVKQQLKQINKDNDVRGKNATSGGFVPHKTSGEPNVLPCCICLRDFKETEGMQCEVLHFQCAGCFDQTVAAKCSSFEEFNRIDGQFQCPFVESDGCICENIYAKENIVAALSQGTTRMFNNCSEQLRKKQAMEKVRREQEEQKMSERKKREISREEAIIVHDILTSSCPTCRHKPGMFDGSAYVVCENNCGTTYCAVCEKKCDSKESCKSHVRGCRYNPYQGSIAIPVDEIEIARNQYRCTRLRAQFHRMDTDMRMTLLQDLKEQFAAIGFDFYE